MNLTFLLLVKKYNVLLIIHTVIRKAMERERERERVRERERERLNQLNVAKRQSSIIYVTSIHDMNG